MSPRPSRSHWTTAPPTKTLPSRAYSVRPPIRHAIVERRRLREATGRRARVHEHEAPGAVGVLGHPGAEASLAEQGGLLVARDPRDGHAAQRRDPLDLAEHPAARAGSREGPPAAPAAPGRAPDPSRRSAGAARSVRDALETSVACTRPPVSFQRSQVSTVPNASSPRAARRARARNVVQEPRELGPGEIGVEEEAGPPAEERPEAPGARARRRLRPCGGPARRWRGGAAGRSPGPTGASSPSGWRSRPRRRRRPDDARLPQARERHAARRLPEVARVVLHPARPRDSAGGIPPGRRRGCARAGRTGSLARRSCPGQGRGRSGSWQGYGPRVAGGRRRRKRRASAND